MSKPSEVMVEQGAKSAKPTDGATTVAVEPSDPLRDEIRWLGRELGSVIRAFSGEEVFELVEDVRRLSRLRREGDASAGAALEARIQGLDVDGLKSLISCLGSFLDLVNLAEDRHRIRVLRERRRTQPDQPLSESIEAAFVSLRDRGLGADEILSLAQSIDIELVFTAHPTEAKRQTARLTLKRLRETVAKLDDPRLIPREKTELLARLRGDIARFWETDVLRDERPSVLDEVRRGIAIVDTLWETVPKIARTFRHQMRAARASATVADAPELEPPTAGDSVRATPSDEAAERVRPLRFGSWIGGDRDGHPFVDAEVTRETLWLLRQEAMQRHLAECERLLNVLTLSTRRHTPSPRLTDTLRGATERWPQLQSCLERWSVHDIYRRWLQVIHARLEATANVSPGASPPPESYRNPRDLEADLEIVAESLRNTGHIDLEEMEIRRWIDLVRVFGFHLYRLDVREHAEAIHEAVAEIAATLQLETDYAGLASDERDEFLLCPAAPAPGALDAVSPATRATVDLLKTLEECTRAYGDGAVGFFVISGSSCAADVFAVRWLQRVTASCEDAAPLRIAPLFESIIDLTNCGSVLDALLSCPPYRAELQRSGSAQTCMIGYSDSTKDGGYLAGAWKLYEAQRALAAVARRHEVDIVFFHGRGGSLGRGGGPAARSIMSLPPRSFSGTMRITEQGEVLAERYDDPQIALRHLEQVISAALVLRASGTEAPPKSEWPDLMEDLAARSRDAYRSLLESDAFLSYFRTATPIQAIEELCIGSRPSRRRATNDLSGLRAIPYTFAWTQSRHMLTAIYGLGAALSNLSKADQKTLREMYDAWPFFRSVLENAELALAKAERSVARKYAELVEDDEIREVIWSSILSDYERTLASLHHLRGSDELLESTPWLLRSIEYRNTYVDALNLIQIELLRRARAAGISSADEDELKEVLRLSVHGIAAGMRITG